AFPSPTSTTVPTVRVSAWASNVSIADLMMLTISSLRMGIGSPGLVGSVGSVGLGRSRTARADAAEELGPETLEAASNARVHERVADADGQPADERFVDGRAEIHGLAGGLRDPGLHGLGLVGGERRGAG